MLRSIRARLTLWYAGAFAVFLALFSVGAYIFLDHTSLARVDEFLAETASAVAGAIEYQRKAGMTDSAAINVVVREFRMRDIDILVTDRTTGRTLSSRLAIEVGPRGAGVSAAPALPSPARLLQRASDAPDARTVSVAQQEDIRLFTMPYTLGSRAYVVGVAQSLRAQRGMLREAEIALVFGIPVMLLLASSGGYLLARQSLRPVMTMSSRAADIGASTLHERLPVANPDDELGRLAGVFNELLGRLESSFERQRRFMADASHELRTPVAIISAESELALSRDDRPSAELRVSLQIVAAEGRRLRGIVEDLFLLARSDAGEQQLRPEALYLHDLLEESTRAVRTLAAARSLDLDLEVGADDMPIVGDDAMLRRLFVNLLENAIKYSKPGGRVRVSAARNGAGYMIDVSDNGAGIPESEQGRIFDRFFRGDSARASSTSGGAGIGLAIARWVARAHGGEVELRESGPRGSTFRVTLPARTLADFAVT